MGSKPRFWRHHFALNTFESAGNFMSGQCSLLVRGWAGFWNFAFRTLLAFYWQRLPIKAPEVYHMGFTRESRAFLLLSQKFHWSGISRAEDETSCTSSAQHLGTWCSFWLPLQRNDSCELDASMMMMTPVLNAFFCNTSAWHAGCVRSSSESLPSTIGYRPNPSSLAV